MGPLGPPGRYRSGPLGTSGTLQVWASWDLWDVAGLDLLGPLGRYINLEGARVWAPSASWAPWDAKKKGARVGARGAQKTCHRSRSQGAQGAQAWALSRKKKVEKKTDMSTQLKVYFSV